jgi:hypothetical protein
LVSFGNIDYQDPIMKRRLFQAVRKLSLHNYHTAKYYHQALNRRVFDKNETIILIYQMGKSGSSTIEKSVKRSRINLPVFKIHGLRRKLIKADEDRFKKLYRRDPDTSAKNARTIWDSQSVRRRAVSDRDNHTWKIITAVRDPVARNVAAFFQTMHSEHGIEIGTLKGQENDDLQKKLTHLFFQKVTWHDYPLEWFDKELKQFFGIDVYGQRFPKEKGYQMLRSGNIEVLVIKLEKFDLCGQKALREFFDTSNFNIQVTNIGAKKYYGCDYQKFLNSLFVPQEYIEKMYNSKLVRQFYTQNEIYGLQRNWTATNQRAT